MEVEGGNGVELTIGNHFINLVTFSTSIIFSFKNKFCQRTKYSSKRKKKVNWNLKKYKIRFILSFNLLQSKHRLFFSELNMHFSPPPFLSNLIRPCVEDNNLFIELDIHNLQNSVNSKIDIGCFHLIHPCIVSS